MIRKTRTAFATFDGAAARAFLYLRSERRLEPLPGFPLDGARKPEFDDRQGRVFQSFSDRRSAAEPTTDPEKELERQFVSDVAQKLEALRAERAFDQIVVSAGPRPLGYFRAVAPKELVAAVKNELSANHVNTPEQALVDVVESAFFG